MTHRSPPPRARHLPRAFREGAPEREEAPTTRLADPPPDDRWFACRRCGLRIAPLSARFAMNGQTDHVRHNPHGLVFHIRCLRNAPGARAIGPPTLEYTWFAGYAWRIALCAGCGAHLGWAFEGERPFWGLIADRLIEVGSEDGPR